MALGSSIISVIPTLFLLGAITILFRDFIVKGKKKRFDLNSTHRTKSAAQKEAKRLREDGLMVRVTMKSEKGKKTFNVWKRNDGDGGDGGERGFANRSSLHRKKDEVFDL